LGTYNLVVTDIHYGAGDNSSAVADPTYGLAHASAEAGTAGLPMLHADSTGATLPSGHVADGATVQAVQGFVWNGPTVDLPADTFVGMADFTNSSVGYGSTTVAMALLTTDIRNPAVAALWLQSDSFGRFTANCGTEGAIAVASSDPDSGTGFQTISLSPSCGATSYHLETGTEFYIWTKLGVYRGDQGFTDASHTFQVGLNDDLDPALRQLMINDLGTIPLALPEPASWAMLLLGFAGLGAVLRTRRGSGGRSGAERAPI
jgi:hypothetical protein